MAKVGCKEFPAYHLEPDEKRRVYFYDPEKPPEACGLLRVKGYTKPARPGARLPDKLEVQGDADRDGVDNVVDKDNKR